MKAIWLACCACGDYGLLQREVEGRDAGAQVLRVGDLDGLVSMARAFPSRRGAAIIAAALFDAEDVRKTVARLTAEGALATVMRVKKRALMRETALVTGYGRIGREMTARLCALGMFVIVCARSEEQMRMAHAAGAHPVPLAQIAAACRQADVIINTIPAHVLGDAALAETARDTPIIELASAPYGLEMQKAVKLGLQVCVESGLPGRYAPLDAGEALFDALTRAMGTRKEDAQCAT